MKKVYHPQEIESKWYQFWQQGGYFAPSTPDSNIPEGNNISSKPNYCIMIPPPNVTGSLHMGHAFQDTIMDALVRYHRMNGNNTLWQVGTDHAGIATQMVVERQLQSEGLSRHDLGRDKFIAKIWDWKEHSGGTICQQLKRLGASVDWETERFTMDASMYSAVQEVFIRLYDEGLIYKGKCLVNWDPVLHTAISDLEVVNQEESGKLWHIKYPIIAASDKINDNSDNNANKNGKNYITVATTRPETLFGDMAVAVNPNDPRYQHLIGQQLQLPLCERTIPIIADHYVEMEFGTGCVKITPAHDFNDYEVGKRHNLELLNILTPDAKINNNAPKPYQGLDRFAARKLALENLTKQDLIAKIEDYMVKTPRGDRTGAVIEPYLTDQWFLKIESLAKPAIAAVESGEIEFVPNNWAKIYFDWMHNIQDWCISRQLWWGHRIPAWYDEDNNIYVGNDEEQIRAKYKLAANIKLRQDEDVLDTWFSSALWPFATLGWPEATARLQQFYPTSVLVTGFDIIFFWVARMIMFGLKFTGKVPFKTVYIHGLIQDQFGQKMSKSKGNVIDPIDLIDGIDLKSLIAKRTTGLMQPKMAPTIEKNTIKQFPNGIPAYGTDAVRFTFFSLATTGRSIRFDLAKLESNRNFCNKLWNAARFVLMNNEQQGSDGSEQQLAPGASGEQGTLSIADRWILSSWQQTKKQIHEHFAKYRFDLVAKGIYEFTWNQYCDWYLELSKTNKTKATQDTLVKVLVEILAVLHPIMPFITEEIYSRIKNDNQEPLIIKEYPKVDNNLINISAEKNIAWIKQFIIGIRTIRAEMNISPGKALSVLLVEGNNDDYSLYQQHQDYLKLLAKLDNITWVDTNDSKLPPAATALMDNMKILIPIAGLIDKDAEIARLNKEIQKVTKDLNLAEKKLANPNYIAKAPADVVAKEKEKLAAAQLKLQELGQSLASMRDL